MSEIKGDAEEQKTLKVTWVSYVALLFAIIFFSGLFAAQKGAISALDFNTVAGKFGVIKEFGKNFMGSTGTGARAGFLFALSLIPVTMLAMGVVEIIDQLGGLRAAQKLLTPLLRPLMGLPGAAGLALITSMQSSDAGAGLTRGLKDADIINEKERIIFAQFQLSGGGLITNYLSSGAVLFAFLTVPSIIPLALIFAFKIIGANITRIYINKIEKDL